jgi:acyl-CoA thioester hydrolase|tara:strand:- start:36946 stop:37356 length:411 start_codon:yes stop_codon:yes gene_type:complete
MEIHFKNKTEVRVRYSETDQMGYCYYGNYAQYFEVGRVEAMRSLGCSYKELEEQGIMLPVRDFQVKYLIPAYYDDVLTVETIITEIKGPKITFTYKLINEKNEVISEAMTSLVFVRKDNMRPIAPPESFLKLINGK